jgi:hypothetical protein
MHSGLSFYPVQRRGIQNKSRFIGNHGTIYVKHCTPVLKKHAQKHITDTTKHVTKSSSSKRTLIVADWILAWLEGRAPCHSTPSDNESRRADTQCCLIFSQLSPSLHEGQSQRSPSLASCQARSVTETRFSNWLGLLKPLSAHHPSGWLAGDVQKHDKHYSPFMHH